MMMMMNNNYDDANLRMSGCSCGTTVHCAALARAAQCTVEPQLHLLRLALCLKEKNEWNKWKNYFYEVKGDIGMSHYEKER